MNLQSGLKLLLASAVAVCCVLPADAQTVITEITGDVQSFHGGWLGNGSEIGKPVTVDFAYDASTVTTSINGALYSASAPLTSADIVGGILGAGINLEPDGPGTGTTTDTLNLISFMATTAASTAGDAPTPSFTGDVFAFNFGSNGTSATLDVIREVYSHGQLDRTASGTVDFSNVSFGQVQAPEIDPSSALSALTLLLGSLAVVRGRKSVKLQSA